MKASFFGDDDDDDVVEESGTKQQIMQATQARLSFQLSPSNLQR